MKTTVLLAVVGVVAVVAVAGAAVASGTVADMLGIKKSGDKAQGTGCDHKHQWNHSWAYEYSWAGEGLDCPYDYDWNHSWEYEYETCPCDGE